MTNSAFKNDCFIKGNDFFLFFNMRKMLEIYSTLKYWNRCWSVILDRLTKLCLTFYFEKFVVATLILNRLWTWIDVISICWRSIYLLVLNSKIKPVLLAKHLYNISFGWVSTYLDVITSQILYCMLSTNERDYHSIDVPGIVNPKDF